VSESKTNQSASAGENSPWSHLEMHGFGDLLPEVSNQAHTLNLGISD
jgi:hypothetical protein